VTLSPSWRNGIPNLTGAALLGDDADGWVGRRRGAARWRLGMLIDEPEPESDPEFDCDCDAEFELEWKKA
jgi:hypothetical protein